MVHIERYLKDSMENEKDLTWNMQMLGLMQAMIHENNISPAEGIKEEKTVGFEARYDAIAKTAGEEYEYTRHQTIIGTDTTCTCGWWNTSTTISCSCPIPLRNPIIICVNERPGS